MIDEIRPIIRHPGLRAQSALRRRRLRELVDEGRLPDPAVRWADDEALDVLFHAGSERLGRRGVGLVDDDVLDLAAVRLDLEVDGDLSARARRSLEELVVARTDLAVLRLEDLRRV